MADPTRLRNSTQICLPHETLSGLRTELEERFVVTVRQEGGAVRIIGSPSEIKEASAFLVRNGIAVA